MIYEFKNFDLNKFISKKKQKIFHYKALWIFFSTRTNREAEIAYIFDIFVLLWILECKKYSKHPAS